MSHPYKKEADSSRKSKAGNMGKTGNLDLPIMKAVGENNPKRLYSSSSASMQHKDQARADGMKRGGHVGKPKHHKPKVAIEVAANPPSPDPSMVAAGAGSSPAPAPPMPPPGAMPPPGQPPMSTGGKISIPSLKWQKAGGGSGSGRLEESDQYSAAGKKPKKIMGSN